MILDTHAAASGRHDGSQALTAAPRMSTRRRDASMRIAASLSSDAAWRGISHILAACYIIWPICSIAIQRNIGHVSDLAPERAVPAESRSPAWRELLFVFGLGLIYLLARKSVSDRTSLAVVNGRAVLTAERWLNVAPELAMNHWLAGRALLCALACDYYDVVALVVTACLASWAWWRRPASSRLIRNELALALLIAFVIFTIFPVAPPRLVSHEFIDLTAQSGSVRSWYHGYLGQLDQFAALPSVHVISACWCAIAVPKVIHRHRIRQLFVVIGLGYVMLTGMVVMATANHYLFDVLSGILTAALAATIVEWLIPRLHWGYERRSARNQSSSDCTSSPEPDRSA